MSQKTIKLNQFIPRDYQQKLVNSFEEGKIKRFVAIWPRRCLSGDSHIIMADGSWKYLKDIQPGDEIISWNEKYGRFESDIVLDHWQTEEKITKITQSFSCLPIVTSEDHVFAHAIHSSDKVKWNALRDIGKNRSLMQYAGLLGEQRQYGNAWSEFFGYMLSDGYCADDQQPKFTNSNYEIISRVKKLISFLGINTRIIESKQDKCWILRFPEGDKNHFASVKDIFRKFKINEAKKERRLPKDIWKWGRDDVLIFFAALISGDGNIYIHKKTRISERKDEIVPAAVEITLNCGISDHYAWDCYWLLRKLGLLPQVPYKEKNSNWKIKIAKCEDIKILLSKSVIGKQEKQIQALVAIQNRSRQAQSFKGCFRLRYKTKDHKPEKLYDLTTMNNHNFVANGYLVHNSGKDICALNLLLRSALRRIGTYFYVFPTFSMGRRIIWDAIDIDGRKVIDHYIPQDIIESKNEQQMRIRLINGSQIQILGSDDVDKSLVGTNAVGIVFSEYALQDPHAWQLSIPILKASDGWALFVSTVRGRNHFYDLYETVKDREDWFCEKLTINDTKHISAEEIELEIEKGDISRPLAMQEYYNDFNLHGGGSYYGKYVDDLRRKGQITNVIWEPSSLVNTSIDIGWNDPTVIIWFQLIGRNIHIIDYYENNKISLADIAKIIKEKPYTYNKHLGPFDIAVTELTSGISRWRALHELGITFVRYTDGVPRIEDGIEEVRRILPRVWIDELKCKNLIKALDNYSEDGNAKLGTFKGRPIHDKFSHAADAMRYLAVGLSKISGSNSSPEEINKRYNEAMYGSSYQSTGFFSDFKGY